MLRHAMERDGSRNFFTFCSRTSLSKLRPREKLPAPSAAIRLRPLQVRCDEHGLVIRQEHPPEPVTTVAGGAVAWVTGLSAARRARGARKLTPSTPIATPSATLRTAPDMATG